MKHFVTVDVTFGGIKNYCKRIVDLTSSPVAITSMVNFSCLLFFNFKYTAMAVLVKISMYIYTFFFGGDLS